MTELMHPGIDGKPVGYVDDEGDVLPLENLDEIEELQQSDTIIEDLPYPDRRESVPVSYPESIQQNKARIQKTDLARNLFKLTAQEELGGGITQHDDEQATDRPLDEVIRGSEDWQTEIGEAVEQFGMNQIDLDDFTAMSETQKEQFSLHFKEFFESLKGRPNFIETRQGNIEHDFRLGEWYGKSRTPEELLAYSKRIRELLALLDETGIPQKVSEYLHTHRYVQHGRGSRSRAKRINHREYQIGFIVRKNGSKKLIRKSE